MAILTDIVDRVTAWTQENICNPVHLKAPPENDKDPTGPGYEYKLVTPTAFPMFAPGMDKLPEGVSTPNPSACVRIADGEDGRNMGTVNMEIWLIAWNPGIHWQDVLIPVKGKKSSFRAWTEEEAKAAAKAITNEKEETNADEKAVEWPEIYYRRTADGWRDLWNWIDTSLRALESTESIDGIAIDREAGISFSPMKEDGWVVDMYPYWYGVISFTLRRPIVRNIKSYDEFL